MADVAMGNLRFDLTADNSQFMAAVKQAKEAQTAAASEMGSKFVEASQKAQQALQKMTEGLGQKTLDAIRKLQELGKAAGDVWNKGAEGAEEATGKLVDAASSKLTGMLYKLTGSIPHVGKFMQTVADIIVASGAWDTIKEKFLAAGALWADGLLGKFKAPEWGQSIRDTLVSTAGQANSVLGQFFDKGTMDEQQKNVEGFANNVKKHIDDMVEGIRTKLQKMAGIWDGISSEVKKALEGLDAQNKRSAFANSLLGASEGEKQRQRAITAVEDQSGKKLFDMNDKEREATLLKAEQAMNLAAEAEAYRKAEQEARNYADSVDSVVAALKRQGDMAMANAGRGMGKSAYDRELERGQAMVGSYGRGRQTGLENDPSVQAAMVAAAQRAQQGANMAYQLDQQRMVNEAAQKTAFDQGALGQSVGEIERMRTEMELTNKAKREGIPLDEATRGSILATADAMGRYAQATAEARERMNEFREVGRTVAGALEESFGRWIQGTQVHWKEFMQGLQADLARLAFRKGIEGLIMGTATGGGGLVAGLAGLFGGFRADGGDVSSGKAYIVGENGPEMFVPKSAGGIVPNHGLSGSGAAHVTYTVNVQGALGREDMAAIARAHAEVAMRRAVGTVNEGFPARQRQFQMLGA